MGVREKKEPIYRYEAGLNEDRMLRQVALLSFYRPLGDCFCVSFEVFLSFLWKCVLSLLVKSVNRVCSPEMVRVWQSSGCFFSFFLSDGSVS